MVSPLASGFTTDTEGPRSPVERPHSSVSFATTTTFQPKAPRGPEETLHAILASQRELFTFLKDQSRLRNKPDKYAEWNRAFASMAVMGIFLASVLVAALALVGDSKFVQKSRTRADDAIDVCWIVGLMFAVFSSLIASYLAIALSPTAFDGSDGDDAVFEASLTLPGWMLIIAGLLLVVGLGIWSWNEHSQTVGIASTVVGVGLALICCALAVVQYRIAKDKGL